jgi:hypothetical protein
MKQADDFITMEATLEATVTNGAYEFTSGESSMSMDMGKGMSEEDIEYFGNMSDEQKNAFLEQSGEEIPEGWKVSWDGLTLNMEGPLSPDELAGMKNDFNLENIPDDAVIKTNANKTKYTINISFTGEDGTTANMEIKAIKK